MKCGYKSEQVYSQNLVEASNEQKQWKVVQKIEIKT